jgi:2-dehydro-3-deoxygalactonokinase
MTSGRREIGSRRSSAAADAAFVAVDWGTSSFRGWLLAADGTPLAHSRGSEGMLHCTHSGFAPVLDDHLARLGASAAVPVLICGMAGARQGWREAPYLDTPARLDALHEGAVRVDAPGDIRILPGVAQKNAARSDVMRGEETQILGAIEPDFTGLVCIPGTHSKWVRIETGSIVEFTTYMTGELFSVIATHSILAHAVDTSGLPARPGAPFHDGLAAAASEPAGLPAALFRLRAAQLLGYEQRADGAARLSGLLIGTEIASAAERYGTATRLRLLAAGDLGILYEAALAHCGFDVGVADAERASQQGLIKAAVSLWKDRF